MKKVAPTCGWIAFPRQSSATDSATLKKAAIAGREALQEFYLNKIPVANQRLRSGVAAETVRPARRSDCVKSQILNST